MESFVESLAHLAVNFGADNDNLYTGLTSQCAIAGEDGYTTPSENVLRTIFEYKDRDKRNLKEFFVRLKKADASADTVVGDTLRESDILCVFHEHYGMSPASTMVCVVVDYLHTHSVLIKESCKLIREHVVSFPKAQRTAQLAASLDACAGDASLAYKGLVGSMVVSTKKPARTETMVKMALVLVEKCTTFGDVADALGVVTNFIEAVVRHTQSDSGDDDSSGDGAEEEPQPPKAGSPPPPTDPPAAEPDAMECEEGTTELTGGAAEMPHHPSVVDELEPLSTSVHEGEPEPIHDTDDIHTAISRQVAVGKSEGTDTETMDIIMALAEDDEYTAPPMVTHVTFATDTDTGNNPFIDDEASDEFDARLDRVFSTGGSAAAAIMA